MRKVFVGRLEYVWVLGGERKCVRSFVVRGGVEGYWGGLRVWVFRGRVDCWGCVCR